MQQRKPLVLDLHLEPHITYSATSILTMAYSTVAVTIDHTRRVKNTLEGSSDLQSKWPQTMRPKSPVMALVENNEAV